MTDTITDCATAARKLWDTWEQEEELKEKRRDTGGVMLEGKRNDFLYHECAKLYVRAGCVDRKELFEKLKGDNARCDPSVDKKELWTIAGNALKYTQDPRARYRYNDVWTAEQVAARVGHDLHYCESMGRWLVWSGKHWEPDETGAHERAIIAAIRELEND
jgi:hypothetical protein